MFDPYTPISFPMLSFPRPCHHLYYPPNFVLHILPLSFSHPPSSPFLRFSPEWRVLRHCRACIASLFQARAPRLLFPRLPHRLLLTVSFLPPLSPLPVLYTIFDVVVSSYPLARHPLLFFFLLLLLLSSSVSLYPLLLRTYTDVQDDVPFYFIRGYEFFHPRRARVSLSLSPSHQPPPRHGASLKMERRGWLRLCRRRTRRDGWLRDGQSIFFFFISFLFFFWKSLLSLIENCFSSENRSLRGALF